MERTNRNDQGPVFRHLLEAEPGCLKTLSFNEAFYKTFPYMRQSLSKGESGTLAKALAKKIEEDKPFAKAFAAALGEPAFGAGFQDRIDRLVQKVMALDLAELNAL